MKSLCAPIFTAIAIMLAQCAGGGAQLEWDPVPDVAVSNYSVYIGASSGSYTGKVSVGVVTAFPLNTAPGTVTWYRLTATSTNGIESDPSSAVSYTNRNFAPLSIRINLSSADNPEGPWTDETNSPPMRVTASDPKRFYRARVTIDP